jgi:pimeloyl-ACP methyl ester carboxylesterase
LKDESTVFIPGLWFNPQGPLGMSLSEKFDVLDLCGIPTMQERVDKVIGHLRKHPKVTRIIAHSAGCAVAIEAMKQLDDDEGRVKKLILLNSAPAKGVKFMPWNPVFWVTPKYTYHMLIGKDIMLTSREFQNLLSVDEGGLTNMMANLKPDSGRFIREVVLSQYKKQEYFTASPLTRLYVVNSRHDRMIGSTSHQTTRLLGGRRKNAHKLEMGDDHMWPLQNIERVLDELDRFL